MVSVPSGRGRIAWPSPVVFLLAAFAAGSIAVMRAPDLPPHPLAIAAAGVLAVLVAWRRLQAHGLSLAGLTSAGHPVPNDGDAPGTRGRWDRLAARGALPLALAGAVAAGLGHAAWRSQCRLADELPARWEGEDVEIVGVVDELPRAATGGVRFAFVVERIGTSRAHVPRRVSLAWYAAPPAVRTDAGDDGSSTTPRAGTPRGTESTPPGTDAPPPVPVVHAGERWALTVRLQRPHGSVNPAGFDLEAWLFANGLRATGFVRADGANVRLDAFAGRPHDVVERAREQIRDGIFAALPGAPYAGLLAALTVGDQRAIPDAQWTVLNRTGIGHLVSISGLHVTVFALMAGGVAHALLRRATTITTRVAARRLAVAFGLLASTAYVALAGSEVPALRTLAMLAVGAAGLWLGRPGTGRIVWLWALAGVLVVDPWAPLAPGFWLSFGAVALLIFALGSRIADAPSGRLARLAHAWRGATRTQAAVTIGLVPFTLALFGQVSVVSPIANAIAIPLVTFVVVPLALAAAAWPGDALWPVAHVAVSVLMAAMEALASLPAAAWMQHAPLHWTVVAGMAGVLLLLAPRGVPGRALGLAWLLPLVLVVPPSPSPGGAVVTVLDVGQGLAVAIRTASHALLYDTGPRYAPGADAGGRIVAPFLRAAGMHRLSALVVSHADIDHSGGLASVLASVPVGWLSSSLRDDHPGVVALAARGAAWRCEAGQRWTWDGVTFVVLHPDPSAYAEDRRKTNDLSCVLRVDTVHGSILLAGDAEARSEYEMLARGAGALRADVLLTPHHGSRTSSTSPFIAAVAPRWAVVTAGYRNRFGHPRADVLARYASRGVQTLRTDADGAIVVTFGEAGIGIERVRETARRFWHARDRPP